MAKKEKDEIKKKKKKKKEKKKQKKKKYIWKNFWKKQEVEWEMKNFSIGMFLKIIVRNLQKN